MLSMASFRRPFANHVRAAIAVRMSNLPFDLRATHNPHRWYLPVTPPICVGPTGRTFLFGGVGMAAAIAAMERTCNRPVLWATAQYLSFARPGEIVDLDVWVPTAGKTITQARVTGHVGDKEIITVNAAMGERDREHDGQWVAAPPAPPPAACPPAKHWRAGEGDLNSRYEVRTVHGRYPDSNSLSGRSPDGRLVFWVRPHGLRGEQTAVLAIIADFVASGITNAIGARGGGNSLDNTIRFARLEPTEWVLCDIQIEAIHTGVVHGAMRLFSEAGTLMATASQSLILRVQG